ncbi:MAG: hypothetical protein A2Y65_02945 [Deltaproteobacteria bacterium RBG_13_52_11]|nr:MAG: hypothetical protein A2Y65_02945 [Deltaproteobacteria bacterium RBG_13_52_11]
MLHKGLLRFLLFIVIFSLLLSPAYGGSSGIWPLFSYHTSEEQKELEIIGPLFTWRGNKQGTEWGIRPFMYFTNDPSQELWRWEFLYPLGKYQLKEGDGKFYLVPFTLFRDEVTSSAPERRERASSFLTAFWGQTDKDENYGGFFPIAGQLKERFGRDKIAFYLWPLYSRIEDEGEITWRIPWPFFSLMGGKAEGLYVWPLWGYKVRAGEYSRGFVLWPFYAYMDQDLDTDKPVSTRFYLPFYATVRSPGARVDIFIPPLFFHQRVDDPPFEKWEFPWPFFTLVKGEGVRETQVFPLFRVREEEQKKRFYAFWPLYKYEWDRMAAEEETVRRFLLINKYRIVKDLDTGREALDVNLWPLFDYRRGLEAEVSFSIFPLLPLHDEGMERNIYPLLWVYRYTRSPQGEIISDFLWGLYRRRSSSEFSSIQLAFLMRIEKRGDANVSLSFLEGLIRYEGTQEGGKVGFFFMNPAD